MYEVDEIVWAKIQGYPWWPAIIADIETNRFNGKYQANVNFIGDNSHAFLPYEKIAKFKEKMEVYSRVKNKKLKNSIAAAMNILKRKSLYCEKLTLLNNNPYNTNPSFLDGKANTISQQIKRMSNSSEINAVDSSQSLLESNKKSKYDSSDIDYFPANIQNNTYTNLLQSESDYLRDLLNQFKNSGNSQYILDQNKKINDCLRVILESNLNVTQLIQTDIGKMLQQLANKIKTDAILLHIYSKLNDTLHRN